MRDVLMLAAALVSSAGGMAWLALAMKGHWQQVCGGAGPSRAAVLALRTLGALALTASLWLCLAVDHPSMAVLVWVMSLAAAALAVAFTLTWRPRWLRWWALPWSAAAAG
ncbi:MAG TPA: DUF3325 domain-containing protein [Solimonas sp.]